MDPKGYYKCLELNENASDSEIKKQYRKLSLLYHPDKQANKSDSEKKQAEEKFKQINEAYSVLSNPEKKSNYDKFGDAEQHFGFNNPFGNPFGAFFSHQQNNNFKEIGTYITMHVPLSFEEVYNGCTKKLKYVRSVRCKNCHGEGGSGLKICKHCNGTGMIYNRMQTPIGYVQTSEYCKHCNATGHVVDKICPSCNGSGFDKVENIVEVTFPAGIQHNYAICVSEKGNESKNKNGKNGDFNAIAVYNFDTDKYQINGLDVKEKIYIPYYDYILGCNYIINFPDGSKKQISIPPKIEEGGYLRLLKCGIKNGDQRGDYYVQIYMDSIKETSDKELELLEEIKKIHNQKEDEAQDIK